MREKQWEENLGTVISDLCFDFPCSVKHSSIISVSLKVSLAMNTLQSSPRHASKLTNENCLNI